MTESRSNNTCSIIRKDYNAWFQPSINMRWNNLFFAIESRRLPMPNGIFVKFFALQGSATRFKKYYWIANMSIEKKRWKILGGASRSRLAGPYALLTLFPLRLLKVTTASVTCSVLPKFLMEIKQRKHERWIKTTLRDAEALLCRWDVTCGSLQLWKWSVFITHINVNLPPLKTWSR